MSAQPVFTPDIKPCQCGSKAKIIAWPYSMSFGVGQEEGWIVMCDKNHYLAKPCSTQNRAIWRWNNRLVGKADEASK